MSHSLPDDALADVAGAPRSPHGATCGRRIRTGNRPVTAAPIWKPADRNKSSSSAGEDPPTSIGTAFREQAAEDPPLFAASEDLRAGFVIRSLPGTGDNLQRNERLVEALRQMATKKGVTASQLTRPNAPGPLSVQSVMRDLQYALRGLRRQPLFTLVAVAHARRRHRRQYRDFQPAVPGAAAAAPLRGRRIAWCSCGTRYPLTGLPQASVSIPDYLDRRAQAPAIDDATLFTQRSLSLADGGQPEQLRALRVTPSFFSTLGRARCSDARSPRRTPPKAPTSSPS